MRHQDLEILSVDPGKLYFGWARWKQGKLVECGLSKDSRFLRNCFPAVDVCVTEKPRIHRGKEKFKEDVVDLAIAAGEVTGQFPERVYTRLQGLPKAIFQQRAQGALTAEEAALTRTHKKADLYHIWDAIGYGLKYLGRI